MDPADEDDYERNRPSPETEFMIKGWFTRKDRPPTSKVLKTLFLKFQLLHPDELVSIKFSSHRDQGHVFFLKFNRQMAFDAFLMKYEAKNTFCTTIKFDEWKMKARRKEMMSEYVYLSYCNNYREQQMYEGRAGRDPGIFCRNKVLARLQKRGKNVQFTVYETPYAKKKSQKELLSSKRPYELSFTLDGRNIAKFDQQKNETTIGFEYWISRVPEMHYFGYLPHLDIDQALEEKELGTRFEEPFNVEVERVLHRNYDKLRLRDRYSSGVRILHDDFHNMLGRITNVETFPVDEFRRLWEDIARDDVEYLYAHQIEESTSFHELLKANQCPMHRHDVCEAGDDCCQCHVPTCTLMSLGNSEGAWINPCMEFIGHSPAASNPPVERAAEFLVSERPGLKCELDPLRIISEANIYRVEYLKNQRLSAALADTLKTVSDSRPKQKHGRRRRETPVPRSANGQGISLPHLKPSYYQVKRGKYRSPFAWHDSELNIRRPKVRNTQNDCDLLLELIGTLNEHSKDYPNSYGHMVAFAVTACVKNFPPIFLPEDFDDRTNQYILELFGKNPEECWQALMFAARYNTELREDLDDEDDIMDPNLDPVKLLISLQQWAERNSKVLKMRDSHGLEVAQEYMKFVEVLPIGVRLDIRVEDSCRLFRYDAWRSQVKTVFTRVSLCGWLAKKRHSSEQWEPCTYTRSQAAHVLRNGLVAAGGKYEMLLFSDGNLKDKQMWCVACEFMPEELDSVEAVRRQFGDFDNIRNPLKKMSRMGLMATKTWKLTSVAKHEIGYIADLMTEHDDDPKELTDGCSIISEDLLERLDEEDSFVDHHRGRPRLKGEISTMLARVGGAKCMLVVMPQEEIERISRGNFDRETDRIRRKKAEDPSYQCEHPVLNSNAKILLTTSSVKFSMDDAHIEVGVKGFTHSTAARTNKEFIGIAVAHMNFHGEEHVRNFFRSLKRHIERYLKILADAPKTPATALRYYELFLQQEKVQFKIRKMNKLHDKRLYLEERSQREVTASTRMDYGACLQKLRIVLPWPSCRVEGIADWTRRLQPNELFCKIRVPRSVVVECKGCGNKIPPMELRCEECRADRPKFYVLDDMDVGVIKNPAYHPRSYRRFRAVNIPELDALHPGEVLSFSAHPDCEESPVFQLSGADFDGDEFLVVTQQELLPHPNIDELVPTLPYDEQGQRERAHYAASDEYTFEFLEYQRHDRTSEIATLHELYSSHHPDGVAHSKVLALARVHSIALDYSKSGVAPDLPPDVQRLNDLRNGNEKVFPIYMFTHPRHLQKNFNSAKEKIFSFILERIPRDLKQNKAWFKSINLPFDIFKDKFAGNASRVKEVKQQNAQFQRERDDRATYCQCCRLRIRAWAAMKEHKLSAEHKEKLHAYEEQLNLKHQSDQLAREEPAFGFDDLDDDDGKEEAFNFPDVGDAVVDSLDAGLKKRRFPSAVYNPSAPDPAPRTRSHSRERGRDRDPGRRPPDRREERYRGSGRSPHNRDPYTEYGRPNPRYQDSPAVRQERQFERHNGNRDNGQDFDVRSRRSESSGRSHSHSSSSRGSDRDRYRPQPRRDEYRRRNRSPRDDARRQRRDEYRARSDRSKYHSRSPPANPDERPHRRQFVPGSELPYSPPQERESSAVRPPSEVESQPGRRKRSPSIASEGIPRETGGNETPVDVKSQYQMLLQISQSVPEHLKRFLRHPKYLTDEGSLNQVWHPVQSLIDELNQSDPQQHDNELVFLGCLSLFYQDLMEILREQRPRDRSPRSWKNDNLASSEKRYESNSTNQNNSDDDTASTISRSVVDSPMPQGTATKK